MSRGRGAREKIWVVRSGDGATLAEVLARTGDPVSAVAEGRVFIGKKRATRPDAPLRPGDVVRVGKGGEAQATAPEIEILFEKEGLVAAVKPAGIPSVPDHAGSSHAFVALVAAAIGENPSVLRVTSRLDRDVSGVIVFALDEHAEARLVAARAEGRYLRRYVALAGAELEGHGTWDAPIGRAKTPRLRAIGGIDAKPARTHWSAVATLPRARVTMLAVEPVTGRTHQIRVHASYAGAPLVGDSAYGGVRSITSPSGAVLRPSRIALHAARVVLPGGGGGIEARAPAPAELVELWSALGGARQDWDEAMRAPWRTEGKVP